MGLYLLDYLDGGGSILKYVHKQNNKLIQIELDYWQYFKNTKFKIHDRVINHEFIEELIDKNQKLNLQIDYIFGSQISKSA